MLCSWGRRGFMGLFSAGNRIPVSDCFIRWFWAGFAAIAALRKKIKYSIIVKPKTSYIKKVIWD